jgi:hypothetical protein
MQQPAREMASKYLEKLQVAMNEQKLFFTIYLQLYKEKN